ncbi:STAS domain-containing protein [Alkalibacillus silvisoli]|uniref:STAS domain-containing protein n=1 Tax=Alkalibacillus silvisoli TaxID=392823 RepID=A0ABP3JXF2_9BACI
MNYEIKLEGEKVTLLLLGDLDIEATETFEIDFLSKAKEHTNYHAWHIDLKEVPFVDSTGVGLLIHFVETLKELEFDVKVINIQPSVYDIFSLMQVDAILGVELLKEKA